MLAKDAANRDDAEEFRRALERSPHYRPDVIARYARLDIDRAWLTTSVTSLGRWFALLSRLSYDSELFGITEARLEPYLTPEYDGVISDQVIAEGTAFIANVIMEAVENDIDHISAPISAHDSFGLVTLQRSGFAISDSIVTHSLEIGSYDAAAETAAIRPVRLDEAELLGHISELCFSNRTYSANRFNVDEDFDPAKVGRLYWEWAVKSVTRVLADEVLVFEIDGAPAGFITISIRSGQPHPTASIPLNAVAPKYQGKGIYTALVHSALKLLKERGVEVVEIRTQLGNLAVHRTWNRLGARIAHAHHTLRYSIDRASGLRHDALRQ